MSLDGGVEPYEHPPLRLSQINSKVKAHELFTGGQDMDTTFSALRLMQRDMSFMVAGEGDSARIIGKIYRGKIQQLLDKKIRP